MKRRPEYMDCCKNSAICIDYLDPIPPLLRRLYEGDDRRAVEFRRYIRSYNKAFAFTSTGGEGHVISSLYDGRGPPLYKIQGEIFHQLGPVLASDRQRPIYSQLYYIYDHEEALQYRMGRNRTRDSTLMRKLQDLLEHTHPFAEVYRHAFELCESTTLAEYRIQLNFKTGSDRRRYNLPTTEHELAIIIPGDEDAFINSRNVILRARGGRLFQITECNPAYLPLHFPLLFPTGQLRWDSQIPYVSIVHDNTDEVASHDPKFVSLCEFSKFRLHPRPSKIESCHLFYAGLLFHELLVHSWAAAEHSRLKWIRDHQHELRAELYQGVVDALHEGIDVASIGKKVVLPASFTSGPRFMHRNLQNALALLRRLGPSDLFITFTANPHWREIEEALLPHQAPLERPDLIARVFKLKFDSLMHDLMKKRIFGKAIAYVYTVEYQKRGLPHVHLILWLDRSARHKQLTVSYRQSSPTSILNLCSSIWSKSTWYTVPVVLPILLLA